LKIYTEVRLCKVQTLLQSTPDEGLYAPLEQLLSSTTDNLWKLADVIAEQYFSHSQSTPLLQFNTVEDA
jgi:hypothetical protein